MASLSSTLCWPARAVDRGLDSLGGRRWRCVWAVARQTLAEAIRMKIAVFFIILMVLGFWGATQSQGDGTVCGRVQSFLAYSLTSVGILLSLLSIFLSRSLSDELVNRQILVLMTKPVPRWQFLLGKWLGVVLLDALLLGLTGVGIYLTVALYLARQPALNELDRVRLRNEVLCARHASPFKVPSFAAEVNRLYADNLEAGKYDGQDDFDLDAEMQRLGQYVESRWRVVPLGDYRDFDFEHVLCDRTVRLFQVVDADDALLGSLDGGYVPDALRQELARVGAPLSEAAAVAVREPGREWLIIADKAWYTALNKEGRLHLYQRPLVQVRYKAKASRYPADEVIGSLWMIGDPEKNVATYQTPRRDVNDRFHTISVPTDAVAADGTLRVRFWNVDAFSGDVQFDKMFIFEGERAVEVLFVVGSFGGNLVRLLLLAQCKLMFLAAVALLFATVFSFPVACLCSMTVYVLAATRKFVADAFSMIDKEGLTGGFHWAADGMLKGLYWLVPDFAQYNATELLVDGRNVTLMSVLWGTLWLVLVGTGLMLLIAWVLFYRREVAEVSV